MVGPKSTIATKIIEQLSESSSYIINTLPGKLYIITAFTPFLEGILMWIFFGEKNSVGSTGNPELFSIIK